MQPTATQNRFLARLESGKPILLAEGYIFELERRGCIQAGPFCPVIVLEEPEIVKQITQDYVNNGSDVIVACTYYANEAKLKTVGLTEPNVLEIMNKKAIEIAWEVAREQGNEDVLICGDISNSTNFSLEDTTTHELVYNMFLKIATWAKEGNVDFILCETIDTVAEATLALRACLAVALPSVVNIVLTPEGKTRDGYNAVDAMKTLKERGADVVGFNCNRGPATMLPILKEVRPHVEGPLCAAPVIYRTTHEQPSFMTLTDKECKTPWKRPFPTGLDPFVCTRYEVAEFAKEAFEAGVQVVGLCCGNGPHHTRAAAEALGKVTKRSRFSPDMSKHFLFGDNKDKKEFHQHGKVMQGLVNPETTEATN